MYTSVAPIILQASTSLITRPGMEISPTPIPMERSGVLRDAAAMTLSTEQGAYFSRPAATSISTPSAARAVKKCNVPPKGLPASIAACPWQSTRLAPMIQTSPGKNFNFPEEQSSASNGKGVPLRNKRLWGAVQFSAQLPVPRRSMRPQIFSGTPQIASEISEVVVPPLIMSCPVVKAF